MQAQVFHGSHPHPLVPHLAGIARSSTARCMREQCSLCQAVVDAQDSGRAWRCCQCSNFVLCVKCIEVDEQAFPAPQVVVRNPCLSRADPTVAVRTRPRRSGYVLCPLPSGELIEVVAYAEATDEPGTFYFRQKAGGWIHSSNVVCVCPSERSIAVLANLHLQYHASAVATPLSHNQCVEYIDESLALLNESPPFGSVLAFLAAMPVQIAVSQITASTPVEELCAEIIDFFSVVAEFACTTLTHAAEELRGILREASGSARHLASDTGLCFFVRLCGRMLSLIWHLPQNAAVFQNQRVQQVVRTAADVMVEIVGAAAASSQPSESSPDEPAAPLAPLMATQRTRESLRSEQLAELWKSVQADNRNTSSYAAAQRMAWSLLEMAASVHMDLAPATQEVANGYTPELSRDLKAFQSSILMAKSSSAAEEFAVLSCQVVKKALRCCATAAAFAATQLDALNMDVVETCMRILKHSRDERRLVTAIETLGSVCLRNHKIISLVCGIIVPAIVQHLRMTCHVSVVNAAFDLCCVLAVNSPVRGAGNSDASRDVDAPYCTAKVHPTSAPFQAMHRFTTTATGNAIALCAHCAASHRADGVHLTPCRAAPCINPLHTVLDNSPAFFSYFTCQCNCPHDEPNVPNISTMPPPLVPLTGAQRLLGSFKILNIMAQRLRTHRSAVANAVGRLSMLLCCNEEVAQALFCSLVELSSLQGFGDAALSVAACQYFPQVQFLMSTYGSTTIAAYLRCPFGERILDKPVSVDSTPDVACVKGTPSSHGGTHGLTPSPARPYTDVVVSPALQLFSTELRSTWE